MKVGLITDTHLPGSIRYLWPEVLTAFEGCDLILHGGDIVAPEILDTLETVAPVLAAKGNHDDWNDPRMKEVQRLDLEGWRIAMIHAIEPENRPIEELRNQYLKGEHVDVIISGHTHFEILQYRDGVVQINTGSATHPHLYNMRLGTIGFLELEPGYLEARVVKLGETGGMRNPGQELFLRVDR